LHGHVEWVGPISYLMGYSVVQNKRGCQVGFSCLMRFKMKNRLIFLGLRRLVSCESKKLQCAEVCFLVQLWQRLL
jgi:hypothetical protein